MLQLLVKVLAESGLHVEKGKREWKHSSPAERVAEVRCGRVAATLRESWSHAPSFALAATLVFRVGTLGLQRVGCWAATTRPSSRVSSTV